MAYKQEQCNPAKTYGIQTRAIYSCQDLWCTNKSNIFLPRLMAYKQKQYIPAKTYGVQTRAMYSRQDLRHTNNSNIFLLFVHHKSWYNVVILGRCSLFPAKVGLRTYQHHCCSLPWRQTDFLCCKEMTETKV